MRRYGEIIPIGSRRVRLVSAAAVSDAVPARRAGARRVRGTGLRLILILVIVCAVASLAAREWGSAASLRGVPATIRAAEYARALADAEEACAGPEASDGPLRRHCVDEAQFLILFPECDVRCRGVVDAILPHARRTGR